MASRQEEKEQRRLERLKQEETEQRAAARRKRLQMVFGGVLGLAIIAAVAIGIASGVGGGEDSSAEDGGGRAPETPANVELPAPETTDLDDAAQAAGCDLEHPPIEGAGHEEREFTAADYQTNPPTSGPHTPDWYDDGIYAPGDAPDLGMLVHTLEHGRINVQYAPGTPQETVDQLEAFLAEKTGYHALLYENGTEMPYEVAATAWGHLLGCEEMNPQVFDALRTFYDRYVDKGPEQVP